MASAIHFFFCILLSTLVHRYLFKKQIKIFVGIVFDNEDFPRENLTITSICETHDGFMFFHSKTGVI